MSWFSSTPPATNNGASSTSNSVDGCNAQTPYEQSYPTAEAAAVAALEYENPKSFETDTETTGWVKKNPDGTFSPHSPTGGDEDSADPTPKGPDDVAGWHTHAAHDPSFVVDGVDHNEEFSQDDKDFAKANNTPEYVGVPSGTIKKYDPSDGSETTLPNKTAKDPKMP